MAESILGMILRFLIEAYREGKETMKQPSEKEIINWMGKEAYNKIAAREGKNKANEIFYQVKEGKVDPDEYAGIKKPFFEITTS